MQCTYLGSRSPLARQWHLFRCAECRTAKAVDGALARGIKRLNAEPAPAAGLARTLAAIGAVSEMTVLNRGRAIAARRRYRLRPIGAFTAAAMLSAAGWLAYIDMDPGIPVRASDEPTPNAYYMMAGAANAIRLANPTALRGSFSAPRMPGDRIRLALGDASNSGSASSRDSRATGMLLSDAQDQGGPSLTAKRAMVGGYAGALALLRQGLPFPYHTPLRGSQDSTPLMGASDYQLLDRALMLQAEVQSEYGDYMGAANSSLDAMELGVRIARDSRFEVRQMGVTCAATGRRLLWKLADRLDAEQARAAARHLEHICRMQVPFAETLEDNKQVSVAAMQEMFQNRGWRTGFRTDWSREARWPFEGIVNYVRLAPYSQRRIVDDFTRLMDREIEEARKPYSTRVDSIGRIEQQALQDPVAARFFPMYYGSRFEAAAEPETQNALLLTALALRAYEQRHDAPPRDLKDLVPGYLAAVPTDPFGHGQPLGYRYGYGGAKQLSVDGGKRWRALLYSVGPDGTDDGGRPIVSKLIRGQKSDQLYTVMPDSKGDIVAGLNSN